MVNLLKPNEAHEEDRYNFIIESGKERLTRAKLIHHVLIKQAENHDIDRILEILDTPHIARNLFSVTLSPLNYEELRAHFKSHFKIIKAAGGVVKKGNRCLMIYRLGKWDLPKGKINKNEDPKLAAVREVEEECGVQARVKGKLCNTWHTYTMKKNRILKKTTWYTMPVVDEVGMTPQTEEGIEDLKWMTPKEVFHALKNSYRSIEYVMELYYKKINSKVR
ncbi:MAG: NUDIX domain-containing protein [Cyclobacteriaceae bacterium]|nr:NUDIX domain-containing protein [Cyclobacteriaceae bacterium]